MANQPALHDDNRVTSLIGESSTTANEVARVKVNPATGAVLTETAAASSSLKAEDSAHVSGDTGSFILGVRNSAGATLTSADGDYSPIATDGNGKVFVTTSTTEDSTHGSGAAGFFILGVRNDSGATTLTDTNGDYSPIAVDGAGRVLVRQDTQFAEDAPHSSGATGQFVMGVRNDTGATLTSADGDYSPIATTAAGAVATHILTGVNSASPSAGTGTKSNVAGSASSVTILAANSSRKRFSVYNDSSAILYLDTTGGTASSTSYSVQIPAGGYYESAVPVNTNIITGIWASATGNARVVEFA